MTQSNDIKDLKTTINTLLSQNALLIAKTKLLESLLLRTISKVDPEATSAIFTQYIDSLEQLSESYLQELQECYYDVDDPHFTTRQIAQNQTAIAQMKKDERYKGEH